MASKIKAQGILLTTAATHLFDMLDIATDGQASRVSTAVARKSAEAAALAVRRSSEVSALRATTDAADAYQLVNSAASDSATQRAPFAPSSSIGFVNICISEATV